MAEIGTLDSSMQTELHLCRAQPKEDVAAVPTVASVLQAFAVLGELRTKFKHFGKFLLTMSWLLPDDIFT